MSDILNFFTNTETPFMLLFVILFIWYVRESQKREQYLKEQIEEYKKMIKGELGEVSTDAKVMLQVWRTLLKKENDI